MAKLIMGIGIPGSGKTTVLKAFAEKNSYRYICPDDIRAEFSGNAADHSRNSEVWEEAHKRTADALREGETVVFDATFAKDFERKKFIRFVRQNGADKVQGIYADVSFEIANERNRMRERVVPHHAMERMNEMLKNAPPTIEDGFDSIFTINEFQNLEQAETSKEHVAHTREFKTKFR